VGPGLVGRRPGAPGRRLEVVTGPGTRAWPNGCWAWPRRSGRWRRCCPAPPCRGADRPRPVRGL